MIAVHAGLLVGIVLSVALALVVGDWSIRRNR
jgi:hypothetical protein